MERQRPGVRTLATVFSLYILTVPLACAYYNWQYARQNGFMQWLLLGELVPSAKSLVWPYLAFRKDTSPVRDSAGKVKALTSVQLASLEIRKMIDSLNASQQATYLINTGRGYGNLGIRSYSHIEKIVGYRQTALEIGQKANIQVLNGIYPDLGTRFHNDFLSSVDMFLQAYQSNSNELLRQAEERNDRWADWYQTNQKEIQAASDKALGY